MVKNELLVNKGQIKVLNELDPLGYANNFDNNVVMLVHAKDKTYFINIDINSDIKRMYYMINFIIRNEELPRIELFLNHYNLPFIENLTLLLNRFDIPYELKSSFVNSLSTESLGYNYINGEYYSVMIEEDMPTFRVNKTKKLEKKYE